MLNRKSDDMVFGGVCSGIADYYDIDTWLVRLITLILIVCNNVAILVYIVLWIYLKKR